MIEGYKAIAKIFGKKNTLKYIIDGSIEGRLKKKMDGTGVDWLTGLTIECGASKALSTLNDELWQDALMLTNKEKKFFSQFSANGEIPPEANVGREKIPASAIMGYCLSRWSSKGIIGAVKKNCLNSGIAKKYLHELLYVYLRKRVNKAFSISFNFPLRLECLGNDSKSNELKKELKYISNELKKLLKSGKFDSEVEPEFIKVLGSIGCENKDFFMNIIAHCKDKDIMEAALYSYGLHISHSYSSCMPDTALKDAEPLINLCNKLKNVELMIELLAFIDDKVNKFAREKGTLILKDAQILNKYGQLLSNTAKIKEIASKRGALYVQGLLSEGIYDKIFYNQASNSDNLEIALQSFSSLMSIRLNGLNAEWPLKSSLNLQGLKIPHLEKIRLFALYAGIINRFLAKEESAGFHGHHPMSRLLSICPEYSLSALNEKILIFKEKFRNIDNKHKKEESWIRGNYKKILSRDVAFDDKKKIINSMLDKQFCGKEWRKLKDSLNYLAKLKQNMETMLKP